MPKVINYPDPNGHATVGAVLTIARFGTAPGDLSIAYNPNNGDAPLEVDGLALTIAARAKVADILAELDAYLKLARGYV
jgi:hypothetical protein